MLAEIGDWLLRSALALGIVIALVMALRPLWRRTLGSAGVLWLWLLVPAALLATSWPRPSVVVEFAVTSAEIAPVLDSVATMTPIEVASVLDSVATMPAALAPTIGWSALLLVAWCLGALCLLLRLVGQQRDFLRRLGPLNPREDGSYSSSTRRVGPAVVGALRPRIVLPADFETRYDAHQQALVLAHERHHLRRGDLQVNLLASALRCVFWFNPLVHLAATRLRVDQELACDAAVLRKNPDAGRAYATALLNTQLADLGLPVGCYWQSSQSLKWRIAMLKRPSPGTARLLAGATLALFASSAAAVSLWQVQPMTTVAAPASSSVFPMSVPVMTLDISTALSSQVAALDLHVDLPPARIPPALVSLPVIPAPSAEDVRTTAPLTPPDIRDTASAAVDARPEWLPPRVIKSVPATRPWRDQNMTLPPQGTVVVRAELDAEGQLLSASVENSDLGAAYGTSARKAVERWTFEPARLGGEAVAATVLVPVYFISTNWRTERVYGIDAPAASLLRKQPQPVRWPSATGQ